MEILLKAFVSVLIISIIGIIYFLIKWLGNTKENSETIEKPKGR
jgi:hypothetical protein